ncbi:MAG TPA: aminopeptidase [Anaerolineae bacterium]|nr:aminopeptidase [Anaerolineae bacterium]
MPDPRIDSLAAVILDYTTRVGKGDIVVIRGESLGEPLLAALYRQSLQRGAHPHLDVWLPDQTESFFRHASGAQLEYVSPVLRQFYEEFDVMIRVDAEANTKARSNIDASKQSRWEYAQRNLLQRSLDRSAIGEFRWCRTLFPTNAYAQDTEMALSEFEDFVFQACFVDGEGDAVDRWQSLSRRQQRIVDWLQGKKEIRLRGEGTDLALSVEGRTFINCDGGDFNMPDGEIFTSPVETSINGHVAFSYPTCYRGREVENVQLWFEEGRVVKAEATKNLAFLRTMLDTDEGARRLGEFAFGMNPGIQRFTKNILFDEKIGGTVHMALGTAYPETGGANRSAIHWDMICDLRQGGEVHVDGELFAKDGEIVI